MADVKWIKIVTDIFDDEKILFIEQIPNADSIIVIWFKLLILSGKINNGGVLLFRDKMPYTDEMLSTIFRRPINTVRLAIKTFEQFGMIEVINNAITIPNWSKYQTLDQLEERKEYMKNYMQGYREKQKQLADGESACKVNSKVNSKANVNSLELDIEEELDIDKEKKKNPLDDYTENENLKEAFRDYQKMRKHIKATMTEKAVSLALSKLDKLATTDAEKIEILEQSIMNSWKGLFEIKTSKGGTNGSTKVATDEVDYTAYD